MLHSEIIAAIEAANPTRNWSNIHRRIMKLGEEYGEVSEAYLNVTSAGNGKGMTWDDVREEFADLLIVAVDVILTPTDASEHIKDVRKLLEDALTATEAIQTEPTGNLDDLMLDVMSLLGTISRLLVEFNHGMSRIYELQYALLDLVYTSLIATHSRMPDQQDILFTTLQENLASEIERKLAKWARNRNTAATDGTD